MSAPPGVPGPTRQMRSLSSVFSMAKPRFFRSILPRIDGYMDRALRALAADHLKRAVDLFEPDDMTRHLLERHCARGHGLERQLDRLETVAARATQDNLLVDDLIHVEAADRTFARGDQQRAALPQERQG